MIHREYILYLDTTSEKLAVKLFETTGRAVSEKTFQIGLDLHAKLLSTIERFLKPYGGFGCLGGVAIVPGPGRFTAARLGVVAANSIGFALQIPVVAVAPKQKILFQKFVNKKFKPILPVYGKEPNITLSALCAAQNDAD